jgi:signal peptidase II
MFKSFGNVFFMAIASVAIVVVAVLLIKDKENRPGFSLILGGAAGNLMDRFLFGHVTDFLDIYIGKFHWPAFNVADSALTVGIILLTVNSFFNARQVPQTSK